MENKFFGTVLIFVFGVLFIGCQSNLDRSIIEPLTPEELSVIIQKDTLFKGTYSIVEVANKFVLNTDVQRAEYLPLTYSRFHEFIQLASNQSNNYKYLDSLYSSEWKESVLKYEGKIDSLINSYQKEKQENPEFRFPFLIDEMISSKNKGNKTFDNQVVFYMLIEEYFDSNLESRSEYVNRNIRSKLKEKDELSYNLFFQVSEIVGKFSD
ncbi:hypothetical protein [Algoriphagus persicinus]|uniref:hypothetical protein n=1 Tax=Algoriphagus persicinus TaxID=3108754 RepID=UPI002B3FBF6D|nr:hypothetical protein [Algoriphagus sp. E1-3-M2]MEB2784877.1 hypothetical protein [Algoriphagus sp. E1-3-M2]